MANSTRSSQRAKDEENSNGRVTRSSEKGKINSQPNVSDTSTTGLRKSPREISSKKTAASSLGTRKSERVEKRTLPTPAGRRKSERVEKKKMPSPLTRSGRTRNHSSSSPSDSKSSGSLGSRQKRKKEKSVKQLTFEAKEVNENEEHDLGTSQVNIKRMDARMYRSIFKHRKKGCLAKPIRIGKSNQEGDNDSGAKIDECSKGSCSDCKEVSKNGTLPSEDAKAKETRVDSGLSGPVMGLAENNVTPGSVIPSNVPTYETSVVPERVQPDCCGEETLPMSVSRNSILDEDLVRNSVGHDTGEKLVPSKRKGITVDMDSDVSATLSKDDNCNLIPDASPSRPGGNILGTDVSCSKRTRLDYNPTVNESCDPSATEHQVGDDIDASMLQKDRPANVAKNICLICKSEGQLLFCGGKGCNRYYHLSCLEPPLLDVPLRVWHCQFCVRKKIEFGVYSVSEGVESVCDVKEVSFSNVDGFTPQKQFLVKYKGLAHVHNRWVPENQLLLEAPLLLMKFNQKDQTPRLKPEWSLPHRLLQKRASICGKQHDDHINNHAVDNFDSGYEWLVKWRGLGYEHATWELDNASFLCSPEGRSLIRGYEGRFQRAQRISLCSKLDKKPDRGNSINKLPQMPGGVSAGFGNNNLDAVNKLREHWHRGQNAIVIDDHDRILKVVAFILSLHSDTCRPFLVIATAASLHSWEDEFYQLDPSIDVVIYNGNKEIRNIIRRLEFYDKERCILFQVLIVVPEILVEDMDVLGGIEWEAIIVDECQSPKISSYFKQFGMLNTHLRILLFRGQLKDSIVENINILALLDGQCANEKDGLISNSNNSVVQLKEKLSSHIAYRCKSDSFRFVEYWVPAQISHVQLEQYCATLLSNASILRSSSKIDSVGAIHDVLISIRKCCNHPYVVDPSLQPLLTKGLEMVEYLDVDIKASGKLQLFDSMLMELRKNDLRALVLFQSIGGSGKDSIGDILDDFLRLRFGPDSYERIDKSLSPSKKQAAMKKFNDKNNGRFVFLLETCACLSSIKLSSIDTIIIFDSDLNPMNDIRSLQKIMLDSQFELIKMFRLYSAFTVEEKALILAKQDKTLDINLLNMNRGTSHMLLMWGASCLFDELRVFHDGATSTLSLKSLFGRPLLEEAIQEFSSILSEDGEDTDTSNCSILLKVQQNGGTYRGNFSLLGELKLGSLNEESPQFFWTKLLEGKQFQWKYSCSSSQRSRKRVQQFDGSVDGPDLLSEGIAKKRRKVSNNIVDQPSSKSEGEKLSTGITADRPQGNNVESEKKSSVHGEQRSLHLSLKPEIAKLCEVLLLPDNVKRMVDNFLEHVMNNHHVNGEPVSILQAFQIALTWTAASLLKHKLDHKASLVLAKQYLNFDCEKGEVDYIYSMLRCLKKIFLYRTGNYNDTGSPKASKSPNRVYSCTGVAREVELFKKDLSKSIKEIQKKCQKHQKKLRLIHEEDKQRLRTAIEVEKAELERKYKIELAFIRTCSPNDVARTEKLRVLNSGYEKQIVEQKRQHETSFKELEEIQLAEMIKLQDREATWLEDVKSWAKNELLNIVASKELVTGVEYLQMSDQVQSPHGPKNHSSEVKGHDNMVESMTKSGTGVPEIVLCSSTVEPQNLVKHVGANEMGIMVLEDRPVSGSEGHNIAENQYDSQGNIISKHSHSRKQNSDGATSMTDEDNGCENFSHGSQDGCRDDTVTLVLPSSNGEICDGETSDVSSGEGAREFCKISSSNGQGQVAAVNSPLSDERIGEGAIISVLDREAPLEMPGTLNIINCPENVTAVNPPSSMEQMSDGGAENEFSDRVLSRSQGAASPSNGPDNITLLNPHLEHQNSDGVSSSVPEGQIPVEVQETTNEGDSVSVLARQVPIEMPVTVNFTNCLQNATPLNPPSSVDQIADKGSLDVPVLDSVSSSRLGQAPSSSNGPGTISSLNPPLEQQICDGVSLSIPDGDIPVTVPENSASSNFPLATEVEHQPINVSDFPSHHPEASTVVPNQDVVQPHSNSELDSRSPQVVVPPASNSDLDSLSADGVRAQSSNPRNLSTPLEMNNHPMQTATRSASRMPPHLSYDPLKNELEKIQKVIEQNLKNHEDMKLRLKSDFEKELEELRRKYDIKFQVIEVEFQQTKKTLDANLKTVCMSKILADAFRSKCLDLKVSGASGMQQDSSFVQQLLQLSRQDSATRPFVVSGSSSSEPPATCLQSPSTAASSQQMVPPIQTSYSMSGILSNVSARPPLINSMSSPPGDIQAGGEIRAPAPHLQPYRPSATSVPASSLPAFPRRMQRQPSPSNVPVTSLPFSHGPPRPRPATYQSDPQMGHRPDSAGGLATPNLPAMDIHGNANSQSTINLPNVLSHISDVASANLSRFGSNSGSVEADLVCLSDDD